MGQLNQKEIQTTELSTCSNQSLSKKILKETLKNSEEAKEATATKNNAQTLDQRKVKATAKQIQANQTALSSQFEFSNYEEEEEDKAFNNQSILEKGTREQTVTQGLAVNNRKNKEVQNKFYKEICDEKSEDARRG